MTRRPAAPDPSSGRPVIVIGAGGHGRVLIDVLRLLGRRILFATDSDQAALGTSVDGVRVEGTDERVLDYAADAVVLVNAVGSISRPTSRRHVFEQFCQRGYRFDRVIHPTAIVASSVELGEGVQVMAGAVVQPSTKIGDNVLVNTRACIEHDCVIEAHVHISSGVTLAGGVHVGDTTHVGAGATIIQQIDVGSEAVVGAGAVVVRDVAAGTTVVGVPARVIRDCTASPGRSSS